ncbi:MAG: hypothetical protein IJ559_02515 [Prevotella sp.]|nr:hypothetical protein [Prevotella sp.]
MKRIIIMLLIACSAITTMSADPTAAPQKKPANVIATLNAIIQKFGMNEGQIFSVNRNPNTGIMESSTKIVPFSCPTNDVKNDDVLNAVSINFQKEEPLSYQFQHIQPGSNENIYLMVIDNDGKSNNVRIRSNKRQEMWMMCTKNPENPQLRDAYAVTWELSEDKQKTVGTVYMITSLRPDVYVKNLETSKKTFKIEGRVDADIKDSLYNIYIANTAEELENIGDDDYVACVAVINKRFEWQTELDHPVVGRLRCIFPDGELCSAWINLDFVPGETYRITVHNGYYDEDQDYERRVGRQSGKSLLNERQSRGIDDVVADDVAIDTIPGYSEPVTPRQSSRWEPKLEQMMQIEAKGMAFKANMDAIKATYASLEPHFKMKSLTGSERIFAQITKLNKELDAKFQDFIKYLKGLDVPPTEIVEKNKAIGEIHKEILKFYTEQNQGFTEMYKEVGVLTKAAQKTQKYINGLTEKYLKEMSKAIMGAK